jgi:hypothetical protein
MGSAASIPCYSPPARKFPAKIRLTDHRKETVSQLFGC